MKKATYIFSVLLVTFTLIGAGCSGLSQDNTNTTTPNGEQYTMEESEQTARDWIQNESPTYTFDGSNLSLQNSQEIDAGGYQFTFEFESAHGGYGDREGQMVTQVITPHEMEVVVRNGEVVQAITDDRFDEMAGEMIETNNDNSNTTTVENEISLNNVSDGDTISRTTTIEGEAVGPWYFEADFPVVAKDSSGQEIDTFIAKAQSDWMTEDLVPFEVDIDLSNYSGSTATLEFQKANPSGLQQNADSFSIQVNLN